MLTEVCLIRLLLIVLLVIYHSFAPYCGGWRALDNNTETFSSYWWIGKASYSFMLECFTFVSGWVYGFQVYTKGAKILDLKRIISSKLKRLIVPSIIFSILYLLIFKPHSFSTPLSCTYNILEGVGHMWYLPMLFWCFIGVWIIERNKISIRIALILVTILSVFSVLPLPLGLRSTMQYMIYFYIEYLFGRKHLNIDRFNNLKYIVIIGLSFAIVFIISQYFVIPRIECAINQSANNQIFIGEAYLIKRILTLIYSTLGVTTIILLSFYLIHKRHLKLSIFWINFSTYTFGIYIFQQFILQWIYYHTDFVKWFPENSIPWVAFAITMLLSSLFTIILRSTKTGRLLI